MQLATGIVLLVSVATAIAVVARRLGLSEPLVLTVCGVVGSYVSLIPPVTITPDLVLIGLLPPLLYTSAIRTSLVDFRANRRAIGLLSVGLVVFTTLGVAVAAWLVLPIPFAAAAALGAVVAPPDAVAASAVARRVGMPRRIVTILEGESLLNDATALIALRTATLAIVGTVGVFDVATNVLRSVGGGIGVGVGVAAVLGLLRKFLTDPVLDTTLSFLAPFVAYLPAEQIKASGVLAVVVTGLILGHKAPVLQSAASRIAERTNWRTVEFLLENSVFLLIGLQVSTIVGDAWASDLGHLQLIGACAAVLATVVMLRGAWVYPASYLPLLVPRIARSSERPPLSNVSVVAWAGMRGVVTLAAAFALPERTPLRPVLVLAALVVVGGTLLLQGTTLPLLVRLLKLRGPSRAEDALQAAGVLQRAGEAGIRRLEVVATPEIEDEVLEVLRSRSIDRANSAWERLGPTEEERATPSEIYRRLRLEMLAAERAEVLKIRDEGVLDHEVLQKVMATLDVEESMIDRLDNAEDQIKQDQLVPTNHEALCEHLDAAPRTHRPDTPCSCSDCLRENLSWVHLRMCLSCGHVACCDSSTGRHADRHYAETGHPVMRSVEPGEAWRWCYIDTQLG
jgi:Na+/H+ antiporter